MRYHKKFETDSIWSVLKPMSVVGNPVTSVHWFLSRANEVVDSGSSSWLKHCKPVRGRRRCKMGGTPERRIF